MTKLERAVYEAAMSKRAKLLADDRLGDHPFNADIADTMMEFAAECVAAETKRCAKICDDEVTRIKENAKALLKFDAHAEARARVLGAAYVAEVAATIRAEAIEREPIQQSSGG